MRIIVQALTKLFKTAPRITVKASRGLISHGSAQCGIKALQRFSVTYQELTEADQAAVNEVVQYATRFADQYIQHHDENHEYRMQDHSLEEVLMSHATEILDAAERAFGLRLRSHG